MITKFDPSTAGHISDKDMFLLQTSLGALLRAEIAKAHEKQLCDDVEWPQLVLCGDRLAGKSQVLEALSTIRLSQEDGLAANITIKIVLRHLEQPKVGNAKITLEPHRSRPEEQKRNLGEFTRYLTYDDDFSDIVNDALECVRNAECAGLECPGSSIGAGDVLRIEMGGNTKMNMTIVDLPRGVHISDGIHIQVLDESVGRFVADPNSIFLTVVQGSNDFAHQHLLRLAPLAGEAREHNLGLIAGSADVDTESDCQIAAFTQYHESSRLETGLFLLQNPTIDQLQNGIAAAIEAKLGEDFYSSDRCKRRELEKIRERTASLNLQAAIGAIIGNKMERQAIGITEDMRKSLADAEKERKRISSKFHQQQHRTVDEMRTYLIRLATELSNVAQASANGIYYYDNGSCHSNNRKREVPIRLRAAVEAENVQFAANVKSFGMKRKPTDEKQSKCVKSADACISVNEKEMLDWIESVIGKTEGNNLTGNANDALLPALFHEQSGPRIRIAQNHLKTQCALVSRFVRDVLDIYVKEDSIRDWIRKIITESMNQSARNAEKELDLIVDDEAKHLNTYHDDCADSLRETRESRLVREHVQKLHEFMPSLDHFNSNRTRTKMREVLAEFEKYSLEDHDERRCRAALEALNTYSKVSRNTFVDNVCRQVVERHIVRGLLEAFTPVKVCDISDAKIETITDGSHEGRDDRERLEKRVEDLKDAIGRLENLRYFDESED